MKPFLTTSYSKLTPNLWRLGRRISVNSSICGAMSQLVPPRRLRDTGPGANTAHGSEICARRHTAPAVWVSAAKLPASRGPGRSTTSEDPRLAPSRWPRLRSRTSSRPLWCWLLRPGLALPARTFTILMGRASSAERPADILSTWPPPSITDPSIWKKSPTARPAL